MEKYLYKSLLDSNGDADEKSHAIRVKARSSPSSWRTGPKIAIYCVFAFIAGALAGVAFMKWQSWSPFGHYETGFSTETIVAPESIFDIQQIKFSGGVQFDDLTGDESLVQNSHEPIYVGEPSPEIDQAWETLVGGRYFSISEDEAKGLWGEEYEIYRDQQKGGFTGGFDVFHGLHCLNHIRMALRRDHYPEERLHGVVHNLHCIDHLRQTLMCAGSTTIIPTSWRPGISQQYVDAAQVQTCRDFNRIRQFTWDRYNGTLVIPRPKP